MPVETAVVSLNAFSGLWQVAQEIFPSAERRVSKNSQRPSRTRSGVGGSGSSSNVLSIPSGGFGSGTTGFSFSQAGTSAPDAAPEDAVVSVDGDATDLS